MNWVKRMLIAAALVILGVFAIVFFTLGFYRKPDFIRHFETEEYAREQPFVEPATVDRRSLSPSRAPLPEPWPTLNSPWRCSPRPPWA